MGLATCVVAKQATDEAFALTFMGCNNIWSALAVMSFMVVL